MICLSSLFRNFVSLPMLNFTIKSFNFSNECFNYFKHSDLINANIFCDSLYKLSLDSLYVKKIMTLHHNIDFNKPLLTLQDHIIIFFQQVIFGFNKYSLPKQLLLANLKHYIGM